MIYREQDIALFALGSMVETAVEVRERLKEEGYSVTLVNARFMMPLDEDTIRDLIPNHRLLVTLEENIGSGGFGEHIARFLCEEKLDIEWMSIAISDSFVEQGSVDELKKMLGIDADSICERIRKAVRE